MLRFTCYSQGWIKMGDDGNAAQGHQKNKPTTSVPSKN